MVFKYFGMSYWRFDCLNMRDMLRGCPKRVPSGLGRYVPLYKEPISSFLLARSHESSCSHDILSIPPHPLFLKQFISFIEIRRT